MNGGGRVGTGPARRSTRGLVIAFASLAACNATQHERAALLRPARLDCAPPRCIESPAARQGVAVDATSVFAIDDARVLRHERASGALLARWPAPDATVPAGPPLTHLNGGVVVGGRLYAAHSNWPERPPVNTIEIWRARDLAHVGSVPLAVDDAWLNWIDRHAGRWWALLARYGAADAPDGGNRGTRLAALDARFAVEAVWSLPEALLERLAPMSVSGGTWGHDGRLYLSGHDGPELYVTALPHANEGRASAGAPELTWRATHRVPPLDGQGLAFTRDGGPILLWGVERDRWRLHALPWPPARALSRAR